MAQADGSVLIDTKMNNGALEKGFERLKTDAESLGMTCEKAGDKIKMAFASYDVSPAIQNSIAKLQELQVKFADITTDIQSAPERRNGLMKQLEEIYTKADAAKRVLYEMQNASEGKYSKSRIAAVKDDVAMYMGQARELETQIKRLDAETNRLRERSKSVYAQMEATQRRLTQAIASEATKRAKSEEAAANKATRAAERAAAAEERAQVQATKAAERAAAAEERAQIKATKAAEREATKKKKAQDKAYKDATKGARQFATRFSRILSGALVFNALSAGLRQLTSYFGTAMKKNSEFASSFARLKGAFLTAVQPIYEVVAPALIYLMNLLTKVMQAISRFFSLLTGKSTSQIAQNAKNLYEQANATEAVGNAAEEAKKQIMGFDEINKLDDNSSSAGGDSSGSISANFEQPEVPELNLDKMITYTSGALLALGVILTFSGANIPLGLGLIAAGATGLAAEIAANWNSMDTEMQNSINIVLGTLAAGGLAIGAILAFSGANLPLGIALIAMGAVALGSAAALNWDAIKQELQGPLGKVVAIISAELLALGAILAFTGVSLPIGIGLMAAGAVGLISTVAVNWNTIVDALRGPIGELVMIISGSLLMLGMLLAATGVNLPLGIALIAAGAAGLVTVSALNWDSILREIKSVWGSITSWFNEKVKPFLTLGYWQEKFSVIGEAITGVIKNAVNGIIGYINRMISSVVAGMNYVIDALNRINFDIPSWVPLWGGRSFGLDLGRISTPQIPYLAQGAVLPPNKPFLAMVGDQKHGTNVEAPLSTIQEAVALVMEDMSGGMMAGFEANLAALEAILDAVLGIEIDGETLSKAIDSYKRKMAVVRGG